MFQKFSLKDPFVKSHNGEINIDGIKIHSISGSELIQNVDHLLQNSSKATLLPVNAHFINLANRHKWLRDFTNQVDYVISDGRGVLLAARILKQRIPEQIRFLDWIHDVFSLAESRGYSFFFLGANETIIRQAVEKIK